jgi:malonyl-CoA O-methyltransferase
MKDKIKKNFDNASKTYDSVATVQKHVARDLIDFLNQNTNIKNFNNILDIGAGTGFVTEILHNYNQNAKYSLNDISEEMLRVSHKKLGHVDHKIIFGDIEDSEEAFQENYDLIVSNMSFQWINDLEKLLKKLTKHSKTIAFTTLGSKTFQEINNLYLKFNLKSPIKKYFTFTEMQNFIKNIFTHSKEYDISYKVNQYTIFCKNFFEYSKYIRNLGAGINFNCENSQEKHKIKFLYESQEQIDLNYEIFFIIINKKINI